MASSSSVYGPSNGTPSSETDHPRPMSPYAVTKLAQDQLCLAHAARPDCSTSVVALRYFTVYGPRQRHDMFIHRVLTAALQGHPVRIYGDGHQRRDFTYISDVVSATLAAAAAPVAAGVVNIGAGRNHSLLDVLATTQQLTGRRIRIEHATSPNGDVPATLANPAKAASLLNWHPPRRRHGRPTPSPNHRPHPPLSRAHAHPPASTANDRRPCASTSTGVIVTRTGRRYFFDG